MGSWQVAYINRLEHAFVPWHFDAEQVLQLAHGYMDGGSGREAIDQRIAEQRRQAAQPQEAHGNLGKHQK